MKINIITIGKIKQKYLQEAETEYLKRLMPYAKIEIIELKEISFDGRDSVDNTRQKEAELIKSRLPKDTTVIALHEEGSAYTSPQFAKWLEMNTTHGEHLTFVIAGSLGIDRQLLKSCDQSLSLSPLTMPHELARIVLLEQIYRAITILKGKTYHY